MLLLRVPLYIGIHIIHIICTYVHTCPHTHIYVCVCFVHKPGQPSLLTEGLLQVHEVLEV